MMTYLVRRLFQTIFFIFLAALSIYTVLVLLMPGGPQSQYQRVLAGQGPGVYPPPDKSQLEINYKLDKPWPLNFVTWLFDPAVTTRHVFSQDDFNGNITETDTEEPIGINISLGPFELKGSGILTGQFGAQPIGNMFEDQWIYTIRLLGVALFLCVVIGVPIGIIGAAKQNSFFDHALTFGVFSSISVPPFVLGLLLIIFLALVPQQLHFYSNWTWLPYLPVGGGSDLLTTGPGEFNNQIYHMVLPALTLAIPQIALIGRHVRFALLEVLGQDFIRTAWSKGLTRRRIILSHALRNILVPIIVAITQSMAGLVSTAIVVESLFAYPGVAKMLYRSLGGCAITQSMLVGRDPPACPPNSLLPMDYPLALVLLMALLVAIAIFTMIADVLNNAVDPRISQKSNS